MKSVLRWVLRFVIGISFAIGILIINGEEELLSKTTHTPPQSDLPRLDHSNYNGSIHQQGWTDKPISNLYSAGIVDNLLSKKWDSFMFLTYNYYFAEITVADLGLVSQVSISLTHYKEKFQILAEYTAPFKLSEFFEGDISFKTSGLNFDLTRSSNSTHQITDIKFVGYYGNKTITGDLKHFAPKDKCLAFVRPYTSMKCLTGGAEGSILIEYEIFNKEYRYRQEISDSWKFNDQVATSLYDGYRGTGYNWYWVRALGMGWNYNIERGAVIESPIKSAGISFGFLQEKEQNFIVIEGQVIKLTGVDYQLQDGLNRTRLTFTSKNPQGKYSLAVKQKYTYNVNRIIAHQRMDKAYGIWDGEVKFQNGTVFKFDKIYGFVEISKSRF